MGFFKWFSPKQSDQDSHCNTERRRAERRAKRFSQVNELRYRSIVEAAGSAIIGLDLKYRIFEWNRAAERVFGYKREDVLNHNYSDLGISHGKPKLTTLILDQVLEDGRCKNFENTVQSQDGRDSIMLWTISCLSIGGGPPGGIIAIGQDITERKRVEQQLLESEKRLNFVLNTAADGIISINERGKIESFNRAAEQMFGYTQREVMGQSINLLMPEPFHKAHDAYLQHYLQTGQKKIIGIGRVVPGLRCDGSTFTMDITIGEAQLEEGRMFTAVVRDISHRPPRGAVSQQE